MHMRFLSAIQHHTFKVHEFLFTQNNIILSALFMIFEKQLSNQLAASDIRLHWTKIRSSNLKLHISYIFLSLSRYAQESNVKIQQ